MTSLFPAFEIPEAWACSAAAATTTTTMAATTTAYRAFRQRSTVTYRLYFDVTDDDRLRELSALFSRPSGLLDCAARAWRTLYLPHLSWTVDEPEGAGPLPLNLSLPTAHDHPPLALGMALSISQCLGRSLLCGLRYH